MRAATRLGCGNDAIRKTGVFFIRRTNQLKLETYNRLLGGIGLASPGPGSRLHAVFLEAGGNVLEHFIKH